MSSATQWSHDFCLSCDKQTTDGAYCSQACRLADLEKAGNSEPTSPTGFSASSYGSNASSGSGFYLSPAINFSAYKSTPHSPRTVSQPSYFTSYSTTGQSKSSSQRILASPSSRTSLNSIQSSTTTSNQAISEQAMHQLRGYVYSFDQTRDYKRRMTHPY